jgi:hypothetical protein
VAVDSLWAVIRTTVVAVHTAAEEAPIVDSLPKLATAALRLEAAVGQLQHLRHANA